MNWLNHANSMLFFQAQNQKLKMQTQSHQSIPSQEIQTYGLTIALYRTES